MSTIRDTKIDNLRVIGIMLVILAHCGCNTIINDLRCVDVILLVFVSALCAKKRGYSTYLDFKMVVLKRIRRILIPTYVFIAVFGLLSFVAYRVAGKPELFGIRQIINSLLLCEDSVGYIWIMKVYFINALITPIIIKVIYRIKGWQHVLIVVMEIAIYFAIQMVYNMILDGNYIAWILVDQWIVCCLAYLFVAQEALWYKKVEIGKKYIILIWGVVFLLTCLMSENGFSPAEGKRPPNLQYISYGLVISEILYMCVSNKTNNIIEWISKNSLTIYLVHPFFILFFNTIKNISYLSNFSIIPIKYGLTVLGSITVVFLYQRVVGYSRKEYGK